mgnify:CR=1 FL=1
MARARLHLICGNCGCNYEGEWKHQLEEVSEGEIIINEDVYLICGNCVTLHSINDNAKKIKTT